MTKHNNSDKLKQQHFRPSLTVNSPLARLDIPTVRSAYPHKKQDPLANTFYWRLVFCLLASLIGQTAEATNTNSRWQVAIDNDVFAGSNDDQDYTGGLAFIYSVAPTAHSPATPPGISLDGIFDFLHLSRLFFHEETHTRRYANEVGTTSFTPSNIQTSEPQFDDRPYASLVYFSSSRQAFSANQQQTVTQTLSVGMLGLYVSDRLQTGFHRPLKGNLAEGWNNQVSAGGEPTFRYSLSWQTQHWASHKLHAIDLDLSSTLKGNLGYLTDLGWGVSARLGRIHSPWWSNNPLLGDYTERGNTGGQPVSTRSQFYLWSGLFVRARAYNALLQGQFRDSVVRYSRNELNTLIADVWVGLDYVFVGGLHLGYSWHRQSAEISNGKGSRNISWGSLRIAGAF